MKRIIGIAITVAALVGISATNAYAYVGGNHVTHVNYVGGN